MPIITTLIIIIFYWCGTFMNIPYISCVFFSRDPGAGNHASSKTSAGWWRVLDYQRDPEAEVTKKDWRPEIGMVWIQKLSFLNSWFDNIDNTDPDFKSWSDNIEVESEIRIYFIYVWNTLYTGSNLCLYHTNLKLWSTTTRIEQNWQIGWLLQLYQKIGGKLSIPTRHLSCPIDSTAIFRGCRSSGFLLVLQVGGDLTINELCFVEKLWTDRIRVFQATARQLRSAEEGHGFGGFGGFVFPIKAREGALKANTCQRWLIVFEHRT